MQTTEIKRPWIKSKHGKRNNPDSFYQSSLWQNTRKAFIAGFTEWNGQRVSNAICLQCFKEGNRTDMHTVDHIVRIKDGGNRTDHSNLQSLCKRHHDIKSANEGNQRYKKQQGREGG